MTLRGFGPPAAGNEELDGPSDPLSLFGSPPPGNRQIELTASSCHRCQMPARDSVTKHCHLKSGTHSSKIHADPHYPRVHGMQGALRGKAGAPFPAACPREWRGRLWVRSQPAWFQIVSLRSPWQTMNLCLSFLIEQVRITSVLTSEGCREDRREWGPGAPSTQPQRLALRGGLIISIRETTDEAPSPAEWPGWTVSEPRLELRRLQRRSLDGYWNLRAAVMDQKRA